MIVREVLQVSVQVSDVLQSLEALQTYTVHEARLFPFQTMLKG